MEFIQSILPSIVTALIICLAMYLFIKNAKSGKQNKLEEEILTLRTSLNDQNSELSRKEKEVEILNARLTSYDELKTEKTRFEEGIKRLELELSNLKSENINLKKDEERRIDDYKKNIEASNTLQKSLEDEKIRLNNERLEEQRKRLEALKETWNTHERDVENHLRLICKKNVISYIEPNDFPHPGKKPDNIIEILDQYIIFDAKSPANEDLSNFPKYIKTQTENLKKYAKYDNVKSDLFLVIPSNTFSVINEFVFNIGDYNVYIISKDALEPILLSLKKIEEYEFADKLSPEERDNICRVIGKFAHTTKRKIQIEQFFANEFLEILQKCKTQLPGEILKTVIEFENAEKLNPPMEKRRKPILTSELMEKAKEIQKEIELRDIPQIEANITYKKDVKN